jgi:hypothetical protein
MVAFLVGDTPVDSFEYTAPESAFEVGAEVALSVNGVTIPAEVDSSAVTGDWTTFALPPVGAYPVFVVTTVGSRSQRTLTDTLIVDDPDWGWHTNQSARTEDQSLPDDDAILHNLLTISREQVVAFAPRRGDGSVPASWRQAQLMQAKNIRNASTTDPNGQWDDAGGMTIRTYPMDWVVQNLLRPKRGIPAVG